MPPTGYSCYYGWVIAGFADQGTEDIAQGVDSRAARRTLPQSLWPVARRKLDIVARAQQLDNFSIHPGNRLEALRGDRSGQYSIRINEQYRICFTWQPGRAADVEIADYHS